MKHALGSDITRELSRPRYTTDLHTAIMSRLFEATTSAMMLGIALLLLTFPNLEKAGTFKSWADAGIPDVAVILFFGVFGGIRISALIANGRWKYGAYLRAVGAIFGAFLWMQLLYALMIILLRDGTLFIALPMYGALAAGEFVACYRAAADARHSLAH